MAKSKAAPAPKLTSLEAGSGRWRVSGDRCLTPISEPWHLCSCQDKKKFVKMWEHKIDDKECEVQAMPWLLAAAVMEL